MSVPTIYPWYFADDQWWRIALHDETSSGAILFDTDPQTGEYLWVRTTGTGPHGYGIGFRTDHADGIDLYASASGAELALGAMGSYGYDIAMLSVGGMEVSNSGGGRFLIRNTAASDPLEITAPGAGGMLIEAATAGIDVSCADQLSLSSDTSTLIHGGSDVFSGLNVEILDVAGSPELRIYTVDDGPSAPIFRIVNTVSGWEYHMKTGATWTADL